MWRWSDVTLFSENTLYISVQVANITNYKSNVLSANSSLLC